MAKINKVLYNIDQTGDTSSVEKKTARNNIGCPSIITSTNTLPPVETDISTLTFKTDSRVYADNNVIGNIAPNPGQTDAGKFLIAQWAGSPAIGTYGLAAIKQLPTSTISNSGQALIVDASGNPVWSNFNALPNSTIADNGKILVVDQDGTPIWDNISTGGTDTAVYECIMTRPLDGTDTQLFCPKLLDMSEYTMTENYVNCDATTTKVYITRDDHDFWFVHLRGLTSIVCSSVVCVDKNSNFGSELGTWGYDEAKCQIVAGMNRLWRCTHMMQLVQNGVRTTTSSLKTGSISIIFTFSWSV